MSNIAIKGATTGTGTFTIESPATNTDRTLTLPDETGTVLTSGTALSSFPSGFANGVTQADIFRLTGNKSLATSTQEDITANLARANETYAGLIGSGMSESSGIFTFPETGIYLVGVHVVARRQGSGCRRVSVFINVSTDTGSTFDDIADARGGITGHETGNERNHGHMSALALIDVTDTSTFQVKFTSIAEDSSVELKGGTSTNQTYFTFIRLGDT